MTEDAPKPLPPPRARIEPCTEAPAKTGTALEANERIQQITTPINPRLKVRAINPNDWLGFNTPPDKARDWPGFNTAAGKASAIYPNHGLQLIKAAGTSIALHTPEHPAVPLSDRRQKPSGNKGGRPREIRDIDGEKVKALRGDMSQKVFCRRCHIRSEDTLQRAERGYATRKTVAKICKYAPKNGQPLTSKDFQKN